MLSMVSFWCPQEEPASALRTLSFEFAFAVMFLTCGEKEKCVSKVTPRIFGSLSRGTGALLMVI